MSTINVMDRLALNMAEIAGINRVYTFQPTIPPSAADLPAIYPTNVRGMTEAIPAKPYGPGSYVVAYALDYQLLIAPILTAQLDAANNGATFDASAVALIDAVIDYFAAHPRLHTAVLSELPFERDVQVQHQGIQYVSAGSGATFACINYTLSIRERRTVIAPRAS